MPPPAGGPTPRSRGRSRVRAAIISISTSRAAGEASDESTPRLLALAERLGAEVAGSDLVPDDRALIEERLLHWSDGERCELILTTGGTGFSPSDQTPEATRAVLEREAPGIPHAMRDASRAHTEHWMLSRACAGTRGGSLIINFPGSPASIEQLGEALEGAILHALALMADERPRH